MTFLSSPSGIPFSCSLFRWSVRCHVSLNHTTGKLKSVGLQPSTVDASPVAVAAEGTCELAQLALPHDTIAIGAFYRSIAADSKSTQADATSASRPPPNTLRGCTTMRVHLALNSARALGRCDRNAQRKLIRRTFFTRLQ